MVLNIKTHTTDQAVENESAECSALKGHIYCTPLMEWITMEEKGTYILYPTHGVDHYGREGDIYTVPHPQGGSVWKRRGYIYHTPSVE